MKLASGPRLAVVVAAILCCSEVAVQAQTLKESFLATGVTRKVGGYRPDRSDMDQDADIVEVAPKELESPKYGLFEIGDESWAYILDERKEGDSKLYIDSNGDGDLTNDPKAEWNSSQSGKYKMYRGKGEIDLGDGKLGEINFYRFDPTDKRRATLKNTILFYTDYGYEYSFELDGQEFKTFVSGAPTDETKFSIDRDGNGRISSRFERIAMGKAFNFTGTPYMFELSDGAVTLDKSEKELEQMPMPPNLVVGEKALVFDATTMKGDEIKFPSSYAGKIVMLDFWATWCGPCIGEVPNMKEAYANWHDDGFEILGISFDRADMEEKIETFLAKNEQSWPQIYEGKKWETKLGIMHDVSGIPFVLLVDGDSGKILATSQKLRGPGLSDFIKGQLEKKFDVNLEDKQEKPDEDKETDRKEDAKHEADAAKKESK